MCFPSVQQKTQENQHQGSLFGNPVSEISIHSHVALLSPSLRLNTVAYLVLTTPGEKKGAGTKSTEFYSELWFFVVIALLGLILLAIFLSLILQRKIHREPCIRERPPLVPLQKRMTPLSVYPPGETHVGLADTRVPQSGTPLSIRSSRSVSILRIPSQSQISQTYTQGSLHHSISQLMDIPDKKGLADDSLWETIMGHSSGLYVDEEELMNAIKGFSSVTKEHTTFTDTHL